MKPRDFYLACGCISKIWDHHNIELTNSDTAYLIEFTMLENTGKLIKAELFRTIALSAKAALNGKAPRKQGMKTESFYKACDQLASVWDRHMIELTSADKKHLAKLAKALQAAQPGGKQFPRRSIGRPQKKKATPIVDKTLHRWQVSKFFDLVISGEPIHAELFRSVALSAKAVLGGADPEDAFKINESRPEKRGKKPKSKKLQEVELGELEIGIAVAKAIEKHKNEDNPKDLAYEDVAKKYSLTPSWVRVQYRKCLTRIRGTYKPRKEKPRLARGSSNKEKQKHEKESKLIDAENRAIDAENNKLEAQQQKFLKNNGIYL